MTTGPLPKRGATGATGPAATGVVAATPNTDVKRGSDGSVAGVFFDMGTTGAVRGRGDVPAGASDQPFILFNFNGQGGPNGGGDIGFGSDGSNPDYPVPAESMGFVSTVSAQFDGAVGTYLKSIAGSTMLSCGTSSITITKDGATNVVGELQLAGDAVVTVAPTSIAGVFLFVDVTLVGGAQSASSGQTLSAATKIIGVYLLTPGVGTGAPTAVRSSNNVVVTSYNGAIQDATDVRTFRVVLVGWT